MIRSRRWTRDYVGRLLDVLGYRYGGDATEAVTLGLNLRELIIDPPPELLGRRVLPDELDEDPPSEEAHVAPRVELRGCLERAIWLAERIPDRTAPHARAFAIARTHLETALLWLRDSGV